MTDEQFIERLRKGLKAAGGKGIIAIRAEDFFDTLMAEAPELIEGAQQYFQDDCQAAAWLAGFTWCAAIEGESE